MKSAMSKRVIALVIIGTMMVPVVAQGAEVKKDESVYVNLSTDGSFEKSTVSDWIHSDESGATVYDKSGLSNIKNVKSDIKPNKNGEDLIWDMDSSDLYYQGTTNKEMPIDVKVKYFYEDEEINPEDLAGKSGKVKIEIDIKNKEMKEVEINGKKRNIYTPFVVAGEVSFPNDKFSELTTDGGTMLSEGNNNVVAFAKVPGLKDSLQLDSIPFDQNTDKLDKINKLTDGKVVIEADAEQFSLGPIMITAVADSTMLDDLDTAVDLNEYRDMLSQIKDNYDKIIEGDTKLNDGISLGYSKAQEGLAKLSQPNFKEKASLITDQGKVNRSNKLLDDADFAVKVPTAGMGELLTQVKNNQPLIDSLMKDKDKDMAYLKVAGTKVGQVQKFVSNKDNAAKLMALQSDLNSVKENYAKLDEPSKLVSKGAVDNLNKFIGGITAEDLKKAVNTVDNIEKLTPLQQALKNEIAKTEITDENIKKSITNPKDMQQIVNAKTNQFLLNLSKSVNALKTLQKLSKTLPENFDLNAVVNDVNEYGEAYMLFRMEYLAAASMADPTGKEPEKALAAINARSAQLKGMVDLFTAKATDNETKLLAQKLKADIDKEFSQNVSPKGIAADQAKLMAYRGMFNKDTVAALSGSFASLKQMESLLGMTDLLASQETKTAVLSLLNQDTSSLANLSTMLKGMSSLTKEEQTSILNLTKSLSKTMCDVNSNMDIVNSIQALAGGKELGPDSINKFNAFAAKMQQTEEALNKLGAINLSGLDAGKLNDAEKLLDMQNDLKNSQDILRILRESMQQNEVEKARNLINTLPSYTSKLDELKNGSQQLADGIKEYGTEAIDKLNEKGNDGLTAVDEISQAKDALVQSSKDYGCFSGKDDSMNGSTKFIMKTKEIKYEAPEEEDKTQETTEKKGFWAWLKSLVGLD